MYKICPRLSIKFVMHIINRVTDVWIQFIDTSNKCNCNLTSARDTYTHTQLKTNKSENMAEKNTLYPLIGHNTWKHGTTLPPVFHPKKKIYFQITIFQKRKIIGNFSKKNKNKTENNMTLRDKHNILSSNKLGKGRVLDVMALKQNKVVEREYTAENGRF